MEEQTNISEKLLTLKENTSEQGERYFAKKFRVAYNQVRKASVMLAKERNKTISSEEAYKELKAFVMAVFDD